MKLHIYTKIITINQYVIAVLYKKRIDDNGCEDKKKTTQESLHVYQIYQVS